MVAPKKHGCHLPLRDWHWPHTQLTCTYCAILDGILNGEHVPGAVLSEATLAAEIGGNTVMLELDDRLADRRRFLMFSFGDTFHERRHDIIAGHIELDAAPGSAPSSAPLR